MTQVKNEGEGFKSGVLSQGGAIQRVQDREAKREKERLEKEEYEKHAAQVHAERIKAREGRALELAEKAKAKKIAEEDRQKQVAEQKQPKDQETEKNAATQSNDKLKVERVDSRSNTASLLDDLSKDSNAGASLMRISEDIEAGEGLEGSEAEPIFSLIKGEVYVPTHIAGYKSDVDPQGHDLGELLPAPAVINVEPLSQPPAIGEAVQELLARASNPGPTDSSPNSNIKSKRGCERLQKIINEKRDLERQVEDLRCTVTTLQDVVDKYEIEGQFVERAMAVSTQQKKPAELVLEAKRQIIKYLNSRENEVDYGIKAQCFYKYITDPFYMQMFVQANKPEQWHSMIESIYESIEMQEPNFDNIKITQKLSLQPIRARTSTLGAPIVSSESPVDRIAQHLGNMGI